MVIAILLGVIGFLADAEGVISLGERVRNFKSGQAPSSSPPSQPLSTAPTGGASTAVPHTSKPTRPSSPSTTPTTTTTTRPTTTRPRTTSPPSRPKYWPLGEIPTSAQILACIKQMDRERHYSAGDTLQFSELSAGDVGQEVTLRIKIDPKAAIFYLWVRDATCKPRKVMELQAGDKLNLRGAWTGGFASLIPFDEPKNLVGQEGAINPNVDWTGGASYGGTTEMLWAWS
ncbi:hypothetical protein [Kribbella kalugense]|nr:hypothetical protein [Kribbella kalugense]